MKIYDYAMCQAIDGKDWKAAISCIQNFFSLPNIKSIQLYIRPTKLKRDHPYKEIWITVGNGKSYSWSTGDSFIEEPGEFPMKGARQVAIVWCDGALHENVTIDLS